MIKIIEKYDYSDISYLVQTINNETIIEEHEVRCKSTTIKKDNKLYYLLFDRNYELNKSVFNYINIYMDNLRKAPQTKDKTLVALKYLYSFLSIFNIEIKEMTSDEGAKLQTFLFGYNQEGNDFSLSFNSVRSATSVNDYLSIMRTYVKYLNFRKHPLLQRSGKRQTLVNAITGEVQEDSRDAFDINAKEYHRTQVPKHVTLDEFKLMLESVHSDGDMQLECIIRLMYESGMRSGEVLSSTFEDLKISTEANNRDVYKLILRNRLSNHSWQSPKFLMKIRSKEDYKLKDYKQRGYGYEYVYISKSLYELILDYIEKAHTLQQIKHKKNWFEYCVADSVDENFKEKDNFYIFVNSIGKPLSNKTLNMTIKSLFIKVEVKLNVDGGKYDGLCHRFRHGFAMYQINYNNTPLLLLKELMRHKNIESTAIYYTPESSTIVKIKNKLSKRLYELIPEFDLTKRHF